MKTTFDLPEDLVVELKLRATLEKRKMKDIAAEALRKGLQEKNSTNEEIDRRLAVLKKLGPVNAAQSKALKDYLVEYREDRETMFDR